MSLKLSHINVVVRDMGAMAGFYGRLGVSLGESPPEWAPHHRSSNDDDDTDGGTRVDLDSDRFARVWNQGWPGGPGIVLVFGVESRSEVDRLYEDLTASGCPGQQPPYDAFWGARFAVVADPDGNSVGLMSDVEPNRRTAPPTPAFD